ncbi:MAG TPA: transposase family protein [Streptosporangiaceae bacterium]|nr:transposase family protein [Streptosporangiaceae bacterium]
MAWTGDLMVRPVSRAETARFDQLLEEHHWLGARLFGSVVRHVAVLDGAWVALLGYGSAVLRCTARDNVIGWPDADRLGRLAMLAGQQRFCVLPGGRPMLASAVLARSLARLPGDYLDLHHQVVLAAETFTDPARHAGTCYAAAGFACAGSTAGYARGPGGRGYVFHGRVKRCWLREVQPGGLAALGAPAPSVLFSPPAPAVWLDLPAAQVASLRAHLATHLADPRHARGIRHEHAVTAVIAAAALLAGHTRPASVAAYAAGFGQQALAVFGARRPPRSGGYAAPSEPSFRRFGHGLPPGALAAAVGSWLAGQAAAGTLDARQARRLAARLAAPAVR